MKALLKALVVIFLSGLCYYFGENFDFHWFLIWLAPIPVLVYAYREGFWKSLIVAYVVGLAPGLNMFLGYMPTGLPPVIFFSDMFSQSLSWTAVILLARFMMRRHPSWMMVFAFPALLSLSEWLLSLTSQGTFGTIANSQLPVLAVVQIASLTGFFGVTFIVSLFGSALAYLIVFYTRKKDTLWACLVSACIIVLAISYGAYRLHSNLKQQITEVKVGLVSMDRSPHEIFNPQNAVTLSQEYQPMIANLAKQGAQIVLMPEETAAITPQNKAKIQTMFSLTAKQNNVMIIAGVRELEGAQDFNSAWLFDQNGQLIGTYHKEHFVPVAETGLTAGIALLNFNLDQHKAGIAICRDLDYTNPAHRYGQNHTEILFAPAWDFGMDARVHSQGAFMRGIENGYTLVRVARAGLLSVRSPTGQTLAEAAQIKSGNVTLLATAPISSSSSIYAEDGNWFVWVLGLILLILLGQSLRPSRANPKSER